MDKIERIKSLIAELNQASKLYYNGKQSSLSDKEWDSKFDELKSLEQETGVIFNNSPTQIVGYTVIDNLEKVEHPKPMLSLDKTKEISALEKFLGDKEGVLSWKEDGLTLVLKYENGVLVDAVTRGNGYVGSRVLHNVLTFDNVPKTIQYKGKLIIRGEGLISKTDFEEININGEYANPRNLTSGSIMQLDSKIAKQRHLQFKAFGIVECEKQFELYSGQLEWLKLQGFDTVEYLIVNKKDIEYSINNFFKVDIDDYEFATDGLVLVYNDIKYGDSLGFTSHHFNNGIAFKWEDSTVETTLLDIEFQVGRTGVVTPIAKFQKVEIEGSMVEKASLHNLSILKSLELGVHDIITVYKANLIIPQVDDNLTRSNTFEIPKFCPVCGKELVIKKTDNAEFLMCLNENCKAKLIQKVKHFVSKNAMNIDGFSEATAERFIEEGFIKNLADIYNLEQYKSKITKLEGFGTKSYNNLITAINNSKKCKLANFLFALGIPQVGLGTAKIIAKYCNDDVNKLTSSIASRFDFSSLADIGEITNDEVYNYFDNEDNTALFLKLVDCLEFKVEEKKLNTTLKDLTGKTFVITGEVHTFKNRDEFKELVLSLNGKVSGSVSSKTTFLVNNDINSTTGKNQKAKELNIPIITEEQFNEMIGR